MAFPVKDSIQHLRNINFCYRRGGGSQPNLRYVFSYVKLILEKNNLKEWSLINLDILDV